MADEIQVKSVAHVVFEGFTTLDMYGPVQASRAAAFQMVTAVGTASSTNSQSVTALRP